MSKLVRKGTYAGFLCLLVLLLATGAFAQGRGGGRGGGGGRGSGGGGSHGGGPPDGVGVDRGLGNASERSGGRSDDGLGNASTRSNGRSDAGLERARHASSNLRRADDDLRDHPGSVFGFHSGSAWHDHCLASDSRCQQEVLTLRTITSILSCTLLFACSSDSND